MHLPIVLEMTEDEALYVREVLRAQGPLLVERAYPIVCALDNLDLPKPKAELIREIVDDAKLAWAWAGGRAYGQQL